jgi:hypothetical protein
MDFDPRDYDSRDEERLGDSRERGGRANYRNRDDDDLRLPDFTSVITTMKAANPVAALATTRVNKQCGDPADPRDDAAAARERTRHGAKPGARVDRVKLREIDTCRGTTFGTKAPAACWRMASTSESFIDPWTLGHQDDATILEHHQRGAAEGLNGCGNPPAVRIVNEVRLKPDPTYEASIDLLAL